MIIGICGRKRHGKDTIGTILAGQGFVLTALADPVKKIAMDLFDLSWDQCYGEDKFKEAVDERWGLSPRKILQALGTEVGRNIHPETWVNKFRRNCVAAEEGTEIDFRCDESRSFFKRTYPPGLSLAVTDVRFVDEARCVWGVGGKIIKVVRPGMPSTDNHPSETSQEGISQDLLVINDSSTEDLRLVIEYLLPHFSEWNNYEVKVSEFISQGPKAIKK